jgi:hypothetical protein
MKIFDRIGKAERPILMNTFSVQGILNGTKTQTRRVIKPQPEHEILEWGNEIWKWKGASRLDWKNYAPYHPADLLWVKETCKLFSIAGVNGSETNPERWTIQYKAGCGLKTIPKPEQSKLEFNKWMPSIFMPKTAARLWLEVTDVRAERLQNITTEDAVSEGMEFWKDEAWAGLGDTTGLGPQKFVLAYKNAWHYINASPKRVKTNPYTGKKEDCYVSYPWDNLRETKERNGLLWYVIGNPFVWVIQFEKIG